MEKGKGVDGWTDGWTDGRTDGWTGGWILSSSQGEQEGARGRGTHRAGEPHVGEQLVAHPLHTPTTTPLPHRPTSIYNAGWAIGGVVVVVVAAVVAVAGGGRGVTCCNARPGWAVPVDPRRCPAPHPSRPRPMPVQALPAGTNAPPISNDLSRLWESVPWRAVPV